MPSLKDIKRRIGSVKNTQKITHAMKLVSAAKFARANHAVTSARPYTKAYEAAVGRMLQTVGEEFVSPLTGHEEATPSRRSLVVVMSSDRGLCGSLNSNLLKNANRFIKSELARGQSVDIIAWGKRAMLFARKLGLPIVDQGEKITDKPRYERAKQLTDLLVERFVEQRYDNVSVAFVEFKSALSQTPTIKQILPVKPETLLATSENEVIDQYILEPDADKLLPAMLARLVSGQIFRMLLESAASEHGARMAAMDSATKNAKEVIRKLTLQYNRGRQAAITKELIEITSGAEAL
jgi:F-type H+-transporting ATPase subunit gamma